jgi:hypothetical protein
MTPVDTFLQSVRAAFKPAEGMPAWGWAALLFVILAVVGLVRWRARQASSREDRAALARLLQERRLSSADGAAIARLAQAGGLPPLAVASRLDAFERATARALAGQTPPSPTAGGPTVADDVFARVRRLRLALGFHVVPDHLPLVTTRELVPGMPLSVDHVAATVVDVNEGWFSIVARDGHEAPLKPRALGTPAFVTLTRGHDARYEAHCAALSFEAAGAARKAFLRHDETPVRHQLRAAVRVSAQGTVVLTANDGAAPATGTLVDISVGGCAIESSAALPLGHAVHLAITWGGETYRALPASVLHCDGRGSGFLVRLAFHGLSADDDARLSAAVARHSGRTTGAA